MNNFNGIFKEELENFVIYKRNNGYVFNTNIEKLKNFDNYTIEYKITTKKLTKELVINYIESHKNWKGITKNVYASFIRQFAIYLDIVGIDSYILPLKYYSAKRNFKPYIFTNEEITKIFKSIDNCYLKIHPKKQLQIQLIFELLFSTGMRISEVLNIKRENINYDKCIIEIKETKNGSDRLILINKNLTEKLLVFENEYNNNYEYFFENNIQQKYSPDCIYSIFRKILFNAKIMHTENGPRLHDIRHTFCVNSFKQAIEQGKDLENYLPILCTYVGHTDLSSTYKYLHLTCSVFPEIRDKVKDIINIEKEIKYEEF